MANIMENIISKVAELGGVEDYLEEVDYLEKAVKLRGEKHSDNKIGESIIIYKVMSYDESIEIANSIKNGKIILVNTMNLDRNIVQRLVDFISGACCMLGSTLQEVKENVYLITPYKVEICN